MEEMWRSIKSIFNERISSPFYGSLIVSWLLWNWKIPYVTFFVDDEKLFSHKINYILNHCNNPWHLIFWPLVSTILIIAVFPYVTNYAYKITQKFDAKRVEDRNELQKKQLLTIEQSVQLRLEIQTIEEKIEKTITNKDAEIKILEEQFEDLSKRYNDLQKEMTAVKNPRTAIGRPVKERKTFVASEKPTPTNSEKLISKKVIEKLKKEDLTGSFMVVSSNILNSISMYSGDSNIKIFLTYGLIILRGELGNQKCTYSLTDLGKSVHQKLLLGD